ncbi:GNAT family N-acetyltransferase [Clostridium sp. D2Q-14]|uniref:GNAT family N-acetyltransferase n=1 Tax=Anaeromonas gelatinilytica TaxID=2683194 RepID=UPI00193C1F1D|nr:GNAT family protein [Anaeromonas gelatinilytica]MBS4534419.1 GNAT family N-acetyltransferase [Anaeromonas gelatinilytica]
MDLSDNNKVKIDKLRIEDVYQMRSWGKHESSLFSDYNFPEMTDREIHKWYEYKSKTRNKKCFGIKNEKNRLIGYLTIREIKKITRVATLGLVLDPNYMNRGYGTEALKRFLEYFFYSLNMNKMALQVAKFNERAIKCYKKCGFIITGEFYKVMDIQKLNIEDELFISEINKNFRIKRNKKEMGFYKMELHIKNYARRTNKKDIDVHNSVDMWKNFSEKTQYVDNNNIKNT